MTTYTYDDATGELLKADYSDGTPDIVRTYDRLGNLSSVSDAAGTRNFTYNSYFDLTGETLGARCPIPMRQPESRADIRG